MTEEWKNQLYFGDNLKILRENIPDESVDLIYLDPPFNSKATYNILFDEQNGSQSTAQITVFEDTWHWGLESENIFHELVTDGPAKLAELMQALRSFLGQNDMMAYLTMMAIRLLELHRVLKFTGSIYLHCDPTASHYLKLLLDSIFHFRNFQNEIIWGYKTQGASKKRFARKHDTIFFYSKSQDWKFNTQYEKSFMMHKYGFKGSDFKIDPETGLQYNVVIARDIWNISALQSVTAEKLGYPTQKPEALLDQIINASSDEGDVILDPFCGCGTTISVAERLNRKWIGVDITHLAMTLIRHRLYDTFGSELSSYKVYGAPIVVEGAEALALENRYQFEWWALGLVDARPAHDKKKGADTGIDGFINFFDDNSGKAKKIIVQVKSGKVSAPQIRDLKGVVEREEGVIGAFVTLQEPTKPMIKEAASAGFYIPEHFSSRKFPKIQILTIQELLEDGKKIDYQPIEKATFQKAKRKRKKMPKQTKLA